MILESFGRKREAPFGGKEAVPASRKAGRWTVGGRRLDLGWSGDWRGSGSATASRVFRRVEKKSQKNWGTLLATKISLVQACLGNFPFFVKFLKKSFLFIEKI
jgi:hypothetical protein